MQEQNMTKIGTFGKFNCQKTVMGARNSILNISNKH